VSKQGKATLLGLAAVLLWSTVATAFKLSLRHLHPVELLFFATIFSTAALGFVLLLTGRVRALASFSRSQVLLSAGLGILNPFLYYLVLFKAYDLLPAQEAQPLNYTWAITLAFFSVPLLGQRLRMRDIAAAAVCYVGVLVIATRGDLAGFSLSNPLGVALALGSTLFWALYWIGNARSRRDPVAGLFLNFLFGLGPVTVVWLLVTGPRLPSASGLLGAGYVGFFEMGFTFLLWLGAMKLTQSTARIANLIFLSPFLSLVFIGFVLREQILASSFLGLVLIVSGLLLQQAGKKPVIGNQ
jgi:drug/metabolite transporter (DMT)-like permease